MADCARRRGLLSAAALTQPAANLNIRRKIAQGFHAATDSCESSKGPIAMITPTFENPEGISAGDLYEDVFLHPCLCVGLDEGVAWGVSLIDGSYRRSCDLRMSGIRKLTPEEAWEMKMAWR